MVRTMKDSGVEWIGEIPCSWGLCRLKDFFDFEKGRNAAIYTQEYVAENVGDYPVYSGQTENNGIMGKINQYDYDIDACLFTTTVGAKVMTSKILKGKFSLSQNCLIMKQKKECSINFYYYALMPLFEYTKSLIPTYMQPSLRIEDLKKFAFYVPDLQEQKKIAAFLDEKCGAIDEIISKTEQSIEEYKKLKQSVITKAVTNGIRPNRPMQDSNIEWIGEIPTDWNVRKIFQLFNQVKNKNIGMTENNLLSLSYGKIKKKNIETSFGLLPESFETYNIIEKDDIVLRLTDLQNDHRSLRVGLCKERGIITSAYVTIRLKDKQYAPYLYYLLHTFDIKKGFYGMGDGVRQGLNWDELKHLSLVLPLFDEQKEIADYLDEKCAEIDTLIEKKQQFLSEMANYKKSLIYEYVTGKKEVA